MEVLDAVDESGERGQGGVSGIGSKNPVGLRLLLEYWVVQL